MWIPDLITRTTITSTWGNGVRNQLVQSFATVAERNSHAGSMPDGMLAYCADVDSLFMRRAATPGGWRTLSMPWTLMTPGIVIAGQNVPGSAVTVQRYHWRRVNGTTITLDFLFTVVWPSGLAGNIWINLPAQVAQAVSTLRGVGEAYFVDWNAPKRLFGPAVLLTDRANWSIMDPVTGAGVGLANSTNVTIDGALTYEAVDG